MKLSGTLFSSLSMPRPSRTSELPISVKMAMAHKMTRIRLRFKRFSVDDRPIFRRKPDIRQVLLRILNYSKELMWLNLTVRVWSTLWDARYIATILEADKVTACRRWKRSRKPHQTIFDQILGMKIQKGQY